MVEGTESLKNLGEANSEITQFCLPQKSSVDSFKSQNEGLKPKRQDTFGFPQKVAVEKVEAPSKKIAPNQIFDYILKLNQQKRQVKNNIPEK